MILPHDMPSPANTKLIYAHVLKSSQTNILSGEKVWDIKSVQDQFLGDGVPYNIALCRLVFFVNSVYYPVFSWTLW
jgi:hypothetical protein